MSAMASAGAHRGVFLVASLAHFEKLDTSNTHPLAIAVVVAVWVVR